jgi:hypothetical protein
MCLIPTAWTPSPPDDAHAGGGAIRIEAAGIVVKS